MVEFKDNFEHSTESLHRNIEWITMDFDPDFCHEKERLFQRYSEALQALAMTISELSKEITHPQVMCEAREARETTEAAKVAYSRHIAEHGC